MVEELIEAVRLPRMVDLTVMLLLETAVTRPVKSSMFAKSPLGTPVIGAVRTVSTLDWVASMVTLLLVETIALL